MLIFTFLIITFCMLWLSYSSDFWILIPSTTIYNILGKVFLESSHKYYCSTIWFQSFAFMSVIILVLSMTNIVVTNRQPTPITKWNKLNLNSWKKLKINSYLEFSIKLWFHLEFIIKRFSLIKKNNSFALYATY